MTDLLPPGRRLDVWVSGTLNIRLKRYSESFESAMELIDEMHRRGYGFLIERGHHAERWTVFFLPKDPQQGGHPSFLNFVEDMERVSAQAENLPHAVCLAAKKLLEQN